MQVTINVSGLNSALNDVTAWTEAKIQTIKDTINESALNVQGGAKRRCVVDTGRLRSSIAIEPANGDSLKLRVGSKVFYAPYVEWGTGIFATHPDIPGRRTPWAFPVSATSGHKDYKFAIRSINGQEMYLTKGSKAHPFLFPAAEDERPNYISAMEVALGR
jgi:hypothetical protein